MEVVNKTFKQAEGTVRPLVTPNGSSRFRTSCCGKIHQQQSAPVVKIERTKLESVYIRNILKGSRRQIMGPETRYRCRFQRKHKEIHRRFKLREPRHHTAPGNSPSWRCSRSCAPSRATAWRVRAWKHLARLPPVSGRLLRNGLPFSHSIIFLRPIHISGDHHPRFRAEVEVRHHVTGRQGRHQQVFRIQHTAVAVLGVIGRERKHRFSGPQPYASDRKRRHPKCRCRGCLSRWW